MLETINEGIGYFNSNIGSWVLMVLLVPTGLFLTFYFGFLQIRKFRHAFDIVRGVYDNPQDTGDVTHFQALTTALSATVGIGNIAGVALAIYYGGPGAIFWMWCTGFVGMMTKMAEVTLALRYRKTLKDGTQSGGAMYYVEHGLKKYFGKESRYLALFFAFGIVLCSFGTGNLTQSNTVASALRASYGVPTWITGLISAILVFVVIVGGIRRIAKVTSRLVPFMALFYVGGALLVIVANLGEVLPTLQLIVTSAFTGTAATGGFIGSTFMVAMRFGIARGLFSNEAGEGSAPIAHSAAKTAYPTREGLVALMEPFIDTLLICTMTALVIIMTGAWRSGLQGGPMTVLGFERGLAPFGLGLLGRHIVTLAIALFAFSTAISWSYYGDRCVEYLVGLRWVRTYRMIFCIGYFAGAIWALELVWNLADMALALVAIPNLMAILLLLPELREEIWGYFAKMYEPYQR